MGINKRNYMFSRLHIVSPQSNFWINAMKDEMTSMSQNKVWNLIDLSNDYRSIGCK